MLIKASSKASSYIFSLHHVPSPSNLSLLIGSNTSTKNRVQFWVCTGGVLAHLNSAPPKLRNVEFIFRTTVLIDTALYEYAADVNAQNVILK